MEAKKSTSTQRLAERVGTTISEVILENFMSYEYCRISFRPGLNIICGPNGSGKSSILLAISVALGQAYTERSRRLSDLIRRGKDVARVTLMFDNTLRDGRRPIPFSRSDTFMLSRYLKKDGSYWYEADYREISKSEVLRLFKRFGMNPDNLLIIMHQGMVEEFSITSPQDKLKMVEEAVGFKEYRERIIEAEERLSGLVSEEASIGQIMEGAAQTLDYWKEVYDKYLLKKGLLEKKRFLEREYVWAQVIKNEKALKTLNERLEGRAAVLEDVKRKIERTEASALQVHEKLSSLMVETRKLYFTLLRIEKENSEAEATEKALSDSSSILDQSSQPLDDLLSKLKSGDELFRGLSEDLRNLYSRELQKSLDMIENMIERSSTEIQDSGRRRRDLQKEIRALQSEIDKVEKNLVSTIEKYVGVKVSEAILEFRRKSIEREVKELKRSISEVEENIRQLEPEIERVRPRIETERSPSEVYEDIRINSVHLQSVDDVPDDAEKIYFNYAGTYEELKKRLEEVVENKNRALHEVDERKKVWREAVQRLIDEINPVYQDVLSSINATGLVRLADSDDIEEAGLELLVGFRGVQPTVLDAYTQSGGERSVAVMAFLLSLQQKVLSPFRAIDEFDVHMDPRNREAIFRMIFSYAKETRNVQYLVITPSQLTVMDQDVNILFVQNTYGRSEVRATKKQS